MADTTSTTQSVLLSCPAGAPQVCDALADALGGMLTGSTTLRKARGDDVTPRDPGTLGIELRLDRMSATELRGRLILHAPSPLEPKEGPEVGVTAVDTTLSDEMIARFATRLLSTHDGLQAALSPTGAAQTD